MPANALIGSSGAICLLQLDKTESLAQQFGFSVSDLQAHVPVRRFARSLVKHLSPQLTGVLLEPHHSYYALSEKDPDCGTLFCLDTPTVERDPLQKPPLIQHWGIEHIRNNSACAKIELYYNPYEAEAPTKKALIAEISEYARQQGVPLLLELLLYENGAAGAHPFDELQLFAVQEFRTLCDIFALDYPQSPLGAATITAELDIPWVLTHRAEKYDQFKEEVRICVESGARGYLAGEVFWQDASWWKSKKVDLAEAEAGITTIVRDRVIELARIAGEQERV